MSLFGVTVGSDADIIETDVIEEEKTKKADSATSTSASTSSTSITTPASPVTPAPPITPVTPDPVTPAPTAPDTPVAQVTPVTPDTPAPVSPTPVAPITPAPVTPAPIPPTTPTCVRVPDPQACKVVADTRGIMYKDGGAEVVSVDWLPPGCSYFEDWNALYFNSKQNPDTSALTPAQQTNSGKVQPLCQ